MVVRSLVMLVALSGSAIAQHGGSASPSRTVPREATQFSFLVGQFELVVRPPASGLAARIHGVPRMIGTWKAWRALDGFGIEDELRITDESGNPRSLSHAVRYYDASAKHWIASAIDVHRGIFTTSTAEWRDNVMTVTSRGAGADGKSYLVRGRYTDITPTSFQFHQDRSADEGRTWESGTLRITATRVAAVAPR